GSAIAQQMLPQIKKLDTEVKKLNADMGNHQGKVGSYFKTFVQGAASMATMYVSFQGFTRLIRSTFGIMTSFEKTMSGVAAISGATGTELQKLEEDAKRLGATTSKTATEVAQLQVEYAKLGFTTQEILNATEATVLLSQATGEDLARAAEIAGATIRGFGMDASESSRVVDVMAASFTSSALNLERFAEAMKYVAPVAKASGITLEQTAAMMSKLADAGIHGSMAGTALRQIMLEMAKAGKTGMQGFNEMAKAGLSLADANDEVGQRAATALLILSKNEKAVNNLTESYNNAEGAAKEMADTQMNNLSGSITMLSSAWEGLVLKITSGDGALKRFVDTVSSFVQWLSGANYEMKEYNFNQNVLEQATRKYNDVIAKETNEIDLLFRMLKQTNPESKKRIDLVSEMQKKYPDYISNIDLEKAGVEGLALAQKDYNDQIERKMIIAAKEEATNELLKEANRYIKQRYEAEIQLIKIEARRQQIYGDGMKIITEAESKELEFMKSNETVLESIILGSASAINDYKNQMVEIEKYYSDFIKTSSNANSTVSSGSKKLTKDEVDELIKRLEQQRDFQTSELKLWGAGQSAIF
ncbi:MAG TPA: phage tail tape measure protein, partial [Clostridiaceae bacterium]|nr:phage tail tape measure protein [Clostridiaceae bacterium]